MKRLLLLLCTPLLYASQAQYIAGEKIYNETCISCHAKDGNTNTTIKLLVKPRKLTKSILTQEQSYQIIKEGAHTYGAHADIMPAFKYVYSDKQLHAVAYYISKRFHPNRDKKIQQLLAQSKKLSKEEKANRLQVGKKIFSHKCAKCHGTTGNGNSSYVQMSKQDTNFIYPYNLQKILLNEKQIFLFAKFGGHFWGADKDDMPAWKNKYNDVALKSVAYYVAKKIKNSF